MLQPNSFILIYKTCLTFRQQNCVLLATFSISAAAKVLLTIFHLKFIHLVADDFNQHLLFSFNNFLGFYFILFYLLLCFSVFFPKILVNFWLKSVCNGHLFVFLFFGFFANIFLFKLLCTEGKTFWFLSRETLVL